jgi:hypothetical protein
VPGLAGWQLAFPVGKKTEEKNALKSGRWWGGQRANHMLVLLFAKSPVGCHGH